MEADLASLPSSSAPEPLLVKSASINPATYLISSPARSFFSQASWPRTCSQYRDPVWRVLTTVASRVMPIVDVPWSPLQSACSQTCRGSTCATALFKAPVRMLRTALCVAAPAWPSCGHRNASAAHHVRHSSLASHQWSARRAQGAGQHRPGILPPENSPQVSVIMLLPVM